MGSTDVGPLDVLMVRFPGNQFKGEIAPALGELVANGLIRVIDLLFVYKDETGAVGWLELADLGADLEPGFVDVDGQIPGGLLDEEDVAEAAEGLDTNSSVAILIVENIWAIPFIQSMRNAGAEMVDYARIPADVAQQALDGLSA